MNIYDAFFNCLSLLWIKEDRVRVLSGSFWLPVDRNVISGFSGNVLTGSNRLQIPEPLLGDVHRCSWTCLTEAGGVPQGVHLCPQH